MKVVVQTINWLQAQPAPKRFSLISAVLGIIAATIGLAVWTLLPGYGILFNHLDPKDANQILAQLDQAKIAYQVKNQGGDILIDKRLIDKTRLKLMGTDFSSSLRVGFELFDKTGFGMTDFSQKINYQRALQGELERTINSLDEVASVRVHLVIPEQHLFQQDNLLPRAAVTLHLNRALSPQQVKSIQQLITASVANLQAKQVIIVDQNGNRLTVNEEDNSSAHFAAKKAIEHYLNDKVMQILTPLFPEAGMMVKIDATLNYDELQRELEKPQQQGMITHEKETQHSTTHQTAKKTADQDFSREKSYQFGHEKERFIRANGTVERLTISVVLPRTTAKNKVEQVSRLVKSAVGFNPGRGDTINVEALIEPQQAQPLTSPVPKPVYPSASVYGRQAITTALPGLFILLLAALTYARRKQKQRRQLLLNELNQWLIEHD